MAIRKMVIKNLFQRHVPKAGRKVYVRFIGDRTGTLRDLDDQDVVLTRKSVEKQYGPLSGIDGHIQTVGMGHWCQILRLYSLGFLGYPIKSLTPGTVPVLYDKNNPGNFICEERGKGNV